MCNPLCTHCWIFKKGDRRKMLHNFHLMTSSVNWSIFEKIYSSHSRNIEEIILQNAVHASIYFSFAKDLSFWQNLSPSFRLKSFWINISGHPTAFKFSYAVWICRQSWRYFRATLHFDSHTTWAWCYQTMPHNTYLLQAELIRRPLTSTNPVRKLTMQTPIKGSAATRLWLATMEQFI